MKYVFTLSYILLCLASCTTPAEESKPETLTPIKEEIKLIDSTSTLDTSSISTGKETPKPLKLTHIKAIGIWIPKAIKPKEDSLVFAITWPLIFKYDGVYVTTQPYSGTDATINAKWPSKDGYYKLKSIGRGDSLFYLDPMHRKTYIGNFTDSSFIKGDVLNNVNYLWEYNRISRKEVPDYLRSVLKKRDVFNYNLTK